jgi:putative sterol carrier protein
MSIETEGIDFAAVDPAEFAQTVGKAPEADLREAMRGPMRGEILAEVFRRMEHHFRPGNGADAVIHWTITGENDGTQDRWEAVIGGGKCTASTELRSEPRVSLKLNGVDFLRLVTGNAIGPMLFMSGKLKIEGDLMFAAQIQSMFVLPG